MATAPISVSLSRLEFCLDISFTDKFQITVEDATAIFYFRMNTILAIELF